MADRPACDELERRIKDLEFEAKKHKRIYEKLRQTEATARALLNASTDSAILIAADGTILAANEMAVHMFQKNGEKIVRMNIYDILPSNVAKHKKAKIDRVILSGEPINFEDEIDGHLFYNSVYPIFDRQGNVEKVALYCRDITEQRRIQDTLRVSEEKFRKISSTAHDAFIMMDSNGKISFWNEAAEKIFGYSKQEVMGRELHKFLVAEKYFESFEKGFIQFKITGQGAAIGKTLEMSALRKDRSDFPIELSLSSFRFQGEWHALGIVRDISHRKMEEKERLQKEKLAGVLEMAGAACHELNQPLQIIQSYSEILLSKIAVDNPSHDILTELFDQVLKMGVISKKIMRITKYETKDYVHGSKIIDIDKATGGM